MRTLQRSDNGPVLKSMMVSLGMAFIVMIIATLAVSLFLLWTALEESGLTMWVFMIHGGALLTGGFLAGKRTGSRGWFRGGTLGLMYALIVLLAGFLGFDATLGWDTALFLTSALGFGAFGGIIGVNFGNR